MASTYEYLQGKVSWVKAKTPDTQFGPPGKWTVQFHPNAEALEIIRDYQAKGLKNQLKKNEDGYYTNFSRPVSKAMKGIVKAFHPPEVVDKDKVPFDGQIGNGTDATLKIEFYEHGTPGGGRAYAARWEALRIDNLIPYNPDKDMPEAQRQQVEGLKEQPEQLF